MLKLGARDRKPKFGSYNPGKSGGLISMFRLRFFGAEVSSIAMSLGLELEKNQVTM